jgi:hypothetical protein
MVVYGFNIPAIKIISRLIESLKSDQNKEHMNQFMDLVTPGSGMIMGKFTRLKI